MCQDVACRVRRHMYHLLFSAGCAWGFDRALVKSRSGVYGHFIGAQRDRDEQFKVFATQASIKCLLLSKGCGEAGLNLTAAAHMLLMEPAWNPSQDADAQARVWRLRQTQRCFITRLVFAGCLAEKILQCQAYKCGLWKQALEAADLEQRHLRDIWFFEPEAVCSTWESLACSPRCAAGSGRASDSAILATSSWSALRLHLLPTRHVLRQAGESQSTVAV